MAAAKMIDIRDSLAAYAPVILSVVVVVLLIVWQRLAIPMDAREPPLMRPRIPFIGHLIGMMWQHTTYFQTLSDKYQLPIFTIPLITSKLYITTSPPMIQAAMRAKTLSFDEVAVLFTEKMIGFGPRAMGVFKSPRQDENGLDFMGSMHNAMHESLVPGPALHHMNAQVLRVISEHLAKFGPEFETKPAWLWLRDMFTIATTTALFGAKNPVRVNPDLIQKFWDFEGNSLELMTRPFNYLTARKAYLGRRAVQAALRDFFSAGYGHNDDTSPLIKARAAVSREWGVSPDDAANSEIAMIFVSATNATTTLFWMFCYVYSNLQLIEDLRAEVASVADRQNAGDVIVNITKFSRSCPLLNSVYQEVMRLTNIQTGTRFVLEDTVLEQPAHNGAAAKPILLKKGAILQMPASVVHVATENWGADAHAFDPRRFLKAEAEDKDCNVSAERERLQKKSFYPFGGGRNLCPGRHFAYAEILGTMTILLLGYDIIGANGRLPMVSPTAGVKLGVAVKKPLGPEAAIQVKIRRRAGWEAARWKFSVSDGKKKDAN